MTFQALGCFEAILIDTGCRISVDIDAALQGDKLFHVTDAAKKIPAYARYCKVDKVSYCVPLQQQYSMKTNLFRYQKKNCSFILQGSASLNSLLQQKCFYKIIDVDEYIILSTIILV